MDVKEARKVLWLNIKPRPLGELLNEGYLTKDRLEWAARWAYNPNLKQAAQTLLEADKQPTPKGKEPSVPAPKPPAGRSLPIGLPLDKARATPWPLPPFKGQPMGTLVDSKQLTLKDLGYAVENAWEEKVRQAAIALSLVRLEQAVKEPKPSAGFVHLIKGGRSYSASLQLYLTLIQGFLFGMVLTASTIWLVTGIINASKPHPNVKPISYFLSTQSGIIALAIVTVGYIFIGLLMFYLFNLLTDGIDKKIDEFRRGQEGEDRVSELIIAALDGNWHLVRNIVLPGRYKGDLDFVLVGPPGIWVLEVKNLRGMYRNIGDKWEHRKGKKWVKAPANPSLQAHKNAIRLGNFLKADGLNVFVNSAVVWANQEFPLTVENPMVAVWQYNRLADELGNIWQVEKIPASDRKKIADKFSKLCKAQKKS